MKKNFLIVLLFSLTLINSYAFDFSKLENDYEKDIKTQKYKKAEITAQKILNIAQKENNLFILDKYNLKIADLYLYTLRDYSKAYTFYSRSANYFNDIAFVRLSEMAINGQITKKIDYNLSLYFLNIALDTLKSNRDLVNWDIQIGLNDNTKNKISSLYGRINETYLNKLSESKVYSAINNNDIIGDLATAISYELCLTGVKDENNNQSFCDTKIAIDYYKKIASSNNLFFSKYAQYKLDLIELSHMDNILNTYIKNKDLDNIEKIKKDIFIFLEKMRTNEFALSHITVGKEYEKLQSYNNADISYRKAYNLGAIQLASNSIQNLKRIK